MKVRCIQTQLSNAQRELLRIRPDHLPNYQILLGNEYLVLGITYLLPVLPHGGGVQLEILNDYGHCRALPSFLFEITDSRCSSYWRARTDSDGSMLLWPEEFFAEFFHDDLSEGHPTTVSAFERLVLRMQDEFSN